jgi:hypothetical protein
MGAPVPIDCQQSPAGFTLHCHRSRNTSVCLCQTRVSDSVAAKLAVNNTGCSAASQQRPARGVGVPSGQPRTVRPNCIYSPRTASFCRLSEPACCLSTALDFPLSGHTSDPPRPARAPATRTQCTAAHTAQRARRSDSSCLQAIHNFQASEVSNRRICVFRMDAQRHIEPAASLYPFPLE